MARFFKRTIQGLTYLFYLLKYANQKTVILIMDDKKNLNKKNKIKQTRYKLQRQSFDFLLQIIFIIGIPAFLAVYFGKKIGVARGTHPQPMIIFIILAILFSWTIILIKLAKINRAFKETNHVSQSLKK